jgi:hypothetical protein
MKLIWKILVGAAFAIVVAVAMWVLYLTGPRHSHLRLEGGWEAHVRSRGWPGLNGIPCVVTLERTNRVIATIVFRKDMWDEPFFLSRATNNTFFCIYDNDINWLLFRIDVDRGFAPIPAGSPLAYRVISSSCCVEMVSQTENPEWNRVADRLETMGKRAFRDQCIGPLPFQSATKRELEVAMRHLGNAGYYARESRVPSSVQESGRTNTSARPGRHSERKQ